MSKAQNIAFVCPRFAEGGTVGGAETLLKNLAERCAADGRKVTFLTTCAQNHFTWENNLPAGKKRVGDLDVEFFPVDDDRDISAFLTIQNDMCAGKRVTREEEERWIENSVNSQALYQHLEEQGDTYDRIVLGPYLFGITYFASQIHPERTALVPCLHDEAFAYLSIMETMFEKVSTYLFNTEPERQLAKRILDVPDAKSHVVGMGIDAFDADPSAFAKRHKLNAPYIIYCGRREPLKGTPLIVDYVRTFRERTGRDLKIVFTGSGEIGAQPEMLPHILDVGFVSEKEKHEAMAGAVCFCHPSVNESLGIVLLESWLAATPALVHANGDVLRWQCERSNAGLWFGNYPEFEEELSLLLDKRDIRDALGQAGRKYVQTEYAWNSIDQKLFSALDGN